MNILKRELKAGRKAFILWSIGLFFIMLAGMAKYTGFEGDNTVMEIFDSFPKIVLAVFGMVGVDISSLGGYYAILVYYGIICAVIYGISLGSNVVNRERIDKTYEFIFTKPRSRAYILCCKFLSAVIYITLYSILNYIFSISSIAIIKLENTIAKPIALYTLSMWMVSILFCTLALLLCVVCKKTEKGILYSNLSFVVAFVGGMIYDMLENGEFFRIFSPLKYFLPTDVLNGKLDIFYVIICLAFSTIFMFLSVRLFERKE